MLRDSGMRARRWRDSVRFATEKILCIAAKKQIATRRNQTTRQLRQMISSFGRVQRLCYARVKPAQFGMNITTATYMCKYSRDTLCFSRRSTAYTIDMSRPSLPFFWITRASFQIFSPSQSRSSASVRGMLNTDNPMILMFLSSPLLGGPPGSKRGPSVGDAIRATRCREDSSRPSTAGQGPQPPR